MLDRMLLTFHVDASFCHLFPDEFVLLHLAHFFVLFNFARSFFEFVLLGCALLVYLHASSVLDGPDFGNRLHFLFFHLVGHVAEILLGFHPRFQLALPLVFFQYLLLLAIEQLLLIPLVILFLQEADTRSLFSCVRNLLKRSLLLQLKHPDSVL